MVIEVIPANRGGPHLRARVLELLYPAPHLALSKSKLFRPGFNESRVRDVGDTTTSLIQLALIGVPRSVLS